MRLQSVSNCYYTRPVAHGVKGEAEQTGCLFTSCPRTAIVSCELMPCGALKHWQAPIRRRSDAPSKSVRLRASASGPVNRLETHTGLKDISTMHRHDAGIKQIDALETFLSYPSRAQDRNWKWICCIYSCYSTHRALRA